MSNVPKVENFVGNNGNPVRNQFLIRTDKEVVFQSYGSIIAKQDYKTNQTTLDKRYWDYSKTTGKYRNIFLNETKAETQKKIDNGTYILADLN